MNAAFVERLGKNRLFLHHTGHNTKIDPDVVDLNFSLQQSLIHHCSMGPMPDIYELLYEAIEKCLKPLHYSHHNFGVYEKEYLFFLSAVTVFI